MTGPDRLTIRNAVEADIEQARAILAAGYSEFEASFPAANWVPYLADILDIEGRAEESDLIVAELGDRIVGCVSYFPPGSKASYPTDAVSETWPGDWSTFRLLAVDPSERGRGVGRELTLTCIERARKQGAPAIGLHTTAPMSIARVMYERMGFERAPRYDFQPGPMVVVEAYRLLLG